MAEHKEGPQRGETYICEALVAVCCNDYRDGNVRLQDTKQSYTRPDQAQYSMQLVAIAHMKTRETS